MLQKTSLMYARNCHLVALAALACACAGTFCVHLLLGGLGESILEYLTLFVQEV